jgi:uncharacterized membrane protein
MPDAGIELTIHPGDDTMREQILVNAATETAIRELSLDETEMVGGGIHFSLGKLSSSIRNDVFEGVVYGAVGGAVTGGLPGATLGAVGGVVGGVIVGTKDGLS